MIYGEGDSFTRILSQRYGYVETVAQQNVDAPVPRAPAKSEPNLGGGNH